ncbi:ubiquitin fusion degradation protein, putative [Bodo saltans]|uniref:Ubiquitin fusion degradation protein, putative n=1 Tax=Bodo saltans TaxID=75058 RepID=A0A0S4IUF4_BODSA|nr:ubiquitin fusion degradation protein, putative [Bodo saltans]|eukprot:CUF96407.1 ubiquitin fusion degradation protein, putative [Bodo saltans]
MFFGNGPAQQRARAGIDVYVQHFAAFSGAFAERRGDVIDSGGRILLPTECLRQMANLNLVYPLQFEIKTFAGRSVFAGVLEFESQAGQAILPRWMFEYLQLQPGETVRIGTVALPQGGLVKLRPHQRAFVEAISDPKSVLESHLKHHPVLTRNSTIVLEYLDREFSIDVVETLDTSGKSVKAISTVNHNVTTMELKVEFDRPKDMPDSPVKPPPQATAFPVAPQQQGANVIGGQAGVQFTPLAFKPPTLLPSGSPSSSAPPTAEPPKPTFVPFGGGGRSLTGRTPAGNTPGVGSTPTSSNPSVSATPTTPQPSAASDKFVAFHGAGRSMR